jgi:hypothetical protein
MADNSLPCVVQLSCAEISLTFPSTCPASLHGELGPDHVLIDDRGQPALIDIEGLMFFDIEWEHAYLQLRFGDHYQRLSTRGSSNSPMPWPDALAGPQVPARAVTWRVVDETPRRLPKRSVPLGCLKSTLAPITLR